MHSSSALYNNVEVYETSAKGQKFELIKTFVHSSQVVNIQIKPDETFQTITGFGGSFTQASAHVLYQLSSNNRDKIIEAYFGDIGAQYSLTRTHINSCDFSLGHYSYAPVANDVQLDNFSIDVDKKSIIPMIKESMKVSSQGFKIISSPWTSPPWMKDNNQWCGGKLLSKYYDVYARFFVKYIEAYKKEGVDIWAITVENEPLGNDNNWESMHFSPEEMNIFVKNYLGPMLKQFHPEVKIFGYDQNRDEVMYNWVDKMYDDIQAEKFYDGTAVHWYASTVEYFPEALQYAHQKAPHKHLIQTEACIDAQVPIWQNDAWYWSEEATDWGWTWATDDKKHLHPRYVPVFRYAKDIIGCLNNWVDGWIDWNMLLDRQGGPNWCKNWCIAPIIADTDTDEVYFTPLYYVMKHFSKFMRPGAIRIGCFPSILDEENCKENTWKKIETTAVKNPDGSIAIALFNPTNHTYTINLKLENQTQNISINPKALQTIIIK